jgi:hypothetical protein
MVSWRFGVSQESGRNPRICHQKTDAIRSPGDLLQRDSDPTAYICLAGQFGVLLASNEQTDRTDFRPSTFLLRADRDREIDGDDFDFSPTLSHLL